MKFLNIIFTFKNILSISLIFNVILIYQINKLPQKISDAINLPKKDTVTIVKTQTAQLQNLREFIYFQGKIKKDAIKFGDNYIYDADIPSEIYDGYLTEVNDYDGGTYFLWSRNAIYKSEIQNPVKGWFFCGTTKLQSIEDDKIYLQVLFPIVEKSN